jgi:hypothetical protein
MDHLAKAAASLFIVLNIVTVLFVHRPTGLGSELMAAVRKRSPIAAHRIELAAWHILRYAHLSGLDNRWVMFSRQTRYRWWYAITGLYADNYRTETVVLPLPLQSDRSFLQRYFFDAKEGKFHLNIYNDLVAKEAYSRYLSRRFPTHDGIPIRSIVFELKRQAILSPTEASVRQQYLDPIVETQIMHVFPSPDRMRDAMGQ